jgi:hypothetical protein
LAKDCTQKQIPLKYCISAGALRNKSGGALQIKLVHLEANFGALQNKEWCTPKQETVHLEANFGALRNKMPAREDQDFQPIQDAFSPLDILKQFRYF